METIVTPDAPVSGVKTASTAVVTLARPPGIQPTSATVRVNPDGTLSRGERFFDMTRAPGADAIDGVKVDQLGNVYVSGPGGVWLISAGGTRPVKVTWRNSRRRASARNAASCDPLPTSVNVASGTLNIHFAYDDGGTHYDCNSGDARWAAALR